MKDERFVGDLDLMKIGDRLRVTDLFLLQVLAVRLKDLSDAVAENKRRSSEEGVFSKRRMEVEDARIALMRKWAKELGINPNFAQTFMYQVISESCLMQDEYMVKAFEENLATIDANDDDGRDKLFRKNLLALTASIASEYDENYGKGLFATELHQRFSQKTLFGLVSEIDKKSLAIDLGCATGRTAFSIAPQFDSVIGYDVSPNMIRVAKDSKEKGLDKFGHVKFIEHDLENGFNLEKDSVSLVVMNHGTASDIKNIDKIIASIRHCLSPNGRFLLSFYNSGSLLHTLNFLPWPTQIAAKIDNDRGCLEVLHNGNVYLVYAKPRSVEEVRDIFKGLSVNNISTYPTISSIIPQVLLESEDRIGGTLRNKKAMEMVQQIDTSLASSKFDYGQYVVVTGGK